MCMSRHGIRHPDDLGHVRGRSPDGRHGDGDADFVVSDLGKQFFDFLSLITLFLRNRLYTGRHLLLLR